MIAEISRINITILISHLQSIKFFENIGRGLGFNIYNVRFLTLHYRSFRYFKNAGFNVSMLDEYTQKKNIAQDEKENEMLKEIQHIERMEKFLFSRKLESQYQRAFVGFHNYFKQVQCDVCFVWNGFSSLPKLFVEVAKKHNKKIFFFEISNIKGTFSMDSMGINAA